MGSLLTKSFGRATSIPRRLNVFPEETATPQGTLDILRGKKEIKGKSFFGKSAKRLGRGFGRRG